MHSSVPAPARDGDSRARRSYRWLLAATAAVLLLWMAAKHSLFSRYAYTSDLFTFLQMSYSWLLGKPLLFDARFGSQMPLHHYLALPLLGPLTLLFGVYGLFGAYLAALLAAVYGVLSELRRHGVRTAGAALVLCLAIGPVSFWIFDNPVYGFHGEFFFLPLALAYLVTLLRRTRMRWLVLALLCLTREEGPMVAYTIHVLTVLLPLHGAEPVPLPALLKRLLRITLAYAALMLIGMISLVVASPPEARLGRAIQLAPQLFSSPDLRLRVLVSLRGWAALMSPILVALLYWEATRRTAAAALLALLPLLAVISVGALVYPDNIHNAGWPPRFVLTWTAGIAAVCLGIIRSKRDRSMAVSWGVAGAVFVMQAPLLQTVRAYSITDRVFAQRRFMRDQLTRYESRLLDCLGSTLPGKTYVGSTGDLFSAFHRQWVVWPDHLEHIGGDPDVVVCETAGRSSAEYGCKALLARKHRGGFNVYAIDGISVGYGPAMSRYIAPCRCSRGREVRARRVDSGVLTGVDTMSLPSNLQ